MQGLTTRLAMHGVGDVGPERRRLLLRARAAELGHEVACARAQEVSPAVPLRRLRVAASPCGRTLPLAGSAALSGGTNAE